MPKSVSSEACNGCQAATIGFYDGDYQIIYNDYRELVPPVATSFNSRPW